MPNSNFSPSLEQSPQKAERYFWEQLQKEGAEIDIRYARDLPDDTPDFIIDLLAEFEERVAEFCFAGASGRVLDAGCGNGNLIMRALKFLPSEMEYVGTDFSRKMLSRAEFRAEGIPRAHFSQGCINKLPFKDQSFDRVVSSGVITCLSTIEEAKESLAEFNRVLRPGGSLVVDFFNQLSHFSLVRKVLLRESIRPPEYISPGHFRSLLEDAGFDVQDCRGFDYKPYQGYLFMSKWSSFLDPGFMQERFSRLIEAKVAPHLPHINLFGYRIYVKCVKS